MGNWTSISINNNAYNVPIKWKLQHPPPPPGIWTFEVWVVQIPIPRVKTGVEMPHLKVILGDQMPLPPGQTWQKWPMEQKYICFHEKIIVMSFETRNIEVVLYNLSKNVQCTLIMKPSYTWQIQYFKHQQNDQCTSSCENIKSMYYFTFYNSTTLELLNITYSIARFWLIQVATPKYASFVMKLNLYTTFNVHVFSMEHKHVFWQNYLKIIFFVAQNAGWIVFHRLK